MRLFQNPEYDQFKKKHFQGLKDYIDICQTFILKMFNLKAKQQCSIPLMTNAFTDYEETHTHTHITSH